jgi:hypothetical protein
MVVSSVLITSVFLFTNFEVSGIWQIFPMFLAKLVDFALRKKCPQKKNLPQEMQLHTCIHLDLSSVHQLFCLPFMYLHSDHLYSSIHLLT